MVKHIVVWRVKDTPASKLANAREIKRQRDLWTFARKMGSDDPNWQLVVTGE